MNDTAKIQVHAFDPLYDDLPLFLSTLNSKCHGLKTESPHRHTFYEILVITGGKGIHIIDFESYELKPPIVFFVSPGQIHFWRLSEFLEGYALAFSEDFLLFPDANFTRADEIGFFHTVGKSPELILGAEQSMIIGRLVSSIKQELLTKTTCRASMIRAYLHILVIELQRLLYEEGTKAVVNHESKLVRRFKRLIAERNISEKSVSAYAKEVGISASHLTNLIKSMTGCSPGKLIRNEIVLEAKRLLAHSDFTVSEIGYRLDFDDPSYFARFFRREAGISPTLFRRRIREKYQLFP